MRITCLIILLLIPSLVFGIQIKIGTYSGDGNDNHTITGIGFQPKAVFVNETVGSYDNANWKTDFMAGDTSLDMGNFGIDTDAIKTLNSDGFVLGTNTAVNTNSSNYHYIAFAGDDVITGKYKGDGTDDRDITGLGINPVFVIVQPGSFASNCRFTISGVTDSTFNFNNASAEADMIQDVIADGFQVGSHNVANQNGAQFKYFAVPDISGFFTVGKYKGNDLDDRDITGLGFQPDCVWGKSSYGGTAVRAVWRDKNHIGDLTSTFTASADQLNVIQSLISDGFQVGTGVEMNGLNKYIAWIAFKEGSSGSGSTDLLNRIIIVQ